MTALTAPFFLQQLTDTNGKPLSNGKMYSWVGGSTNLPKPLYYDKDYTTPCPNPLIADASGILPQYFMTSGYYKFEVKTSSDVLIATRDYIDAGSGTTSEANDHKVAVDQYDTNPDYLSNKIQSGNGTTAVEVIGATRYMQIDSKGYVGVDAADQHINYLDQKLVSSPSITMSAYNIGTSTDQNWVMTANVNKSYGSVIPVWVILKNTDPATAPFGLPQADLVQIWHYGYGVAASEHQTTDPGPGDLSIWYLEGGTYWGDAVWVERHYQVGQMILNANHGLYDYLHTHPEDIQHEWYYSNYPAGLYTLNNDSADGYVWGLQIVNQYPDPEYNTDSVLTYNAYEKKFVWVPNVNFAGNGAVKIDQNDSAGFLGYKVQAGAGITITDTYNGVYGRFLSISTSGSNPSGGNYASTMYVANATTVLAPNLISRSELVTLFVPVTDTLISNVVTKFGCFLSQTGAGTLRFTLRDDQYRLIGNSIFVTNPAPSVFLELICGNLQDPVTQTPLSTYTLVAGGRYYLGINWDANGIQLLGDETNQNTNIQPYPAYKVDNLSGIPYQLTGGGEAKQRPFIRVKT